MNDTDGYLSRDRKHLARLQRERRARMVRIDYMPNRNALAIIAAKRATVRPGSVAATNSAVLDAIVNEWAALTGIKCSEIQTPMSPELCEQYAPARMSPDADCSAGAQDFGTPAGINAAIAGARARAYDSEPLPDCISLIMARTKPAPPQRITCGAKRHRDGQPCKAKSEPGKRRCRFHGGRSTGPRTPEGKTRALLNLRRGRQRTPVFAPQYDPE